MQTIYFKGTQCHTYGTLPAVGEDAPCFNLTGADLNPVRCNDFKGRQVVLNIFPSLDTDVCARSVRRFNEEAASLPHTTVICVSMDLPFAMSRFCTIENIKNVTFASAFRSPLFGQKFGVQLSDGPLNGLLARAVIIIGKNRKVQYAELVNELTDEPDYDSALSILKGKG